MDGFIAFIVTILIVSILLFTVAITNAQTRSSVVFDCDNYGKVLLSGEWYSCSIQGGEK